MRHLLLIGTAVSLSGCFAGGVEFPDVIAPSFWKNAPVEDTLHEEIQAEALNEWWHNFQDPILSALVDQALDGSPTRKAAQARILEARGLRRSERASLFPSINGSANGGREQGLFNGADTFYDARFDASYELDIFGKNRNARSARQNALEVREAEYQDISLSLIADVARAYINVRTAQKQVQIAQKNLEAQEKTLELITYLYEGGENPRLDVDRAENVVSTTRASIPEFERQAENARIELAVLVGGFPESLPDGLNTPAAILSSDIAPVLSAPAKILALRPDIRAAAANLRAQTDLAESATADIFPEFNLSGFYGAAEAGFASVTQIWQIALGTAVSIIDFGRVEGQIDAARAREVEAYELYRQTVFEAVGEVETALNDFAKLNERAVLLSRAYESADAAFTLSKTLYSEGEIDFLDVLDAQRTVNDAESAFVSAEGNKAEALIRIYKSLGVGLL